MVLISLRRDACRINKAGYYAAKHGYLEIVNLLRDRGANNYELMRGAARGDQLEILKTFDVMNEPLLEIIVASSYTTKTSRVRDWLKLNGEIPPSEYTSKVLSDKREFPIYMVYYAYWVAHDKLQKYDNEVTKIKSEALMLYLFVRFDIPGIEEYLEENWEESYSQRTIHYCMKHGKYVDLLLRYYEYRIQDIFSAALRYGRFDITDRLLQKYSWLKYEIFSDNEEIMKYAIRDTRIYMYLEKLLGKKLPNEHGLLQALTKDRPKMFRFLFESVNHDLKVFWNASNFDNKTDIKESIECVKIFNDICMKSSNIVAYPITYRDNFINTIISYKPEKESINLPFIQFVYENISKTVVEVNDDSYTKKITAYLENK